MKSKSDINEIVGNSFICSDIITIDPGKSNGAIAKRSEDGKIETWNINKFQQFEDFTDFFRYHKSICRLPVCILEQITTFNSDLPKKGISDEERNIAIGRKYRIEKLKDHYVELRSAIRSAGIPFIEVMPFIWQKYLKIHIPGEDYKDRKERYKQIADDYFNQVRVTKINCDALLLIEFMVRKLKYDSFWVIQNLKKNERKKSLFR